MATRADASALGGVALLDTLRPPPGWFTEAAIGTTYSLELPVALVALVALSGTARDTSDISLPTALRAIETLRDRVRIVTQRGRVAAPGIRNQRILHLLDEVVHGVTFDEGERSFHPKVWLVRYRDSSRVDPEPDRFRLVVGSRNLTSSRAWDLGIALEGTTEENGKTFPDLLPFVRLVGRLAGLDDFTKRFEDARRVAWSLPREVSEAEFGFHGQRQEWDDTALAHLGDDGPRQVLAISPFLDSEGVLELSRRLRVERPLDAPGRRLVSGRADLDKVASSPKGRRALQDLAIACATVPADDAMLSPSEDPDTASLDVRETELDVHAKAILVRYGSNDVAVLFGSPNLTRRGWLGANVEAWVRLRGRATFVAGLSEWASRYPDYEMPPVGVTEECTAEKRIEELAEQARRTLALANLTLSDREHGDSILSADSALSFAPQGVGAELAVARLSFVGPLHVWAAGESKTRLPPCPPAERTRFVRFRLRLEEGGVTAERAWVEEVKLIPELDAGIRNAETVAAVLRPQGFLAYLRGLIDPAVDDGDAEPRDTDTQAGGPGADLDGSDDLSLEWLLRALARSGIEGLAPLRRAIAGYRKALGAEWHQELAPLWAAWDAIDEAISNRGQER